MGKKRFKKKINEKIVPTNSDNRERGYSFDFSYHVPQ